MLIPRFMSRFMSRSRRSLCGRHAILHASGGAALAVAQLAAFRLPGENRYAHGRDQWRDSRHWWLIGVCPLAGAWDMLKRAVRGSAQPGMGDRRGSDAAMSALPQGGSSERIGTRWERGFRSFWLAAR